MYIIYSYMKGMCMCEYEWCVLIQHVFQCGNWVRCSFDLKLASSSTVHFFVHWHQNRHTHTCIINSNIEKYECIKNYPKSLKGAPRIFPMPKCESGTPNSAHCNSLPLIHYMDHLDTWISYLYWDNKSIQTLILRGK